MRDVAAKESASKILEGLTHMTESLQQLSSQAEQEHHAEEERKAKRPRESKAHYGLDLPVDGNAGQEQVQFCFNPAAPAFDPSIPSLSAQNFVQELFTWWNFSAFSWGGEERSTRIFTFFVDHRDHLPRCDRGRGVHLFAAFSFMGRPDQTCLP